MTAPNKISGYTEAQRISMCEKKQRYSDENTVIAAGMESLEKHPESVDRLYYYRCKICRGWHLTKQKNPKCFPIIKEKVSA